MDQIHQTARLPLVRKPVFDAVGGVELFFDNLRGVVVGGRRGSAR